jgi:hypothetical protein
MNRRLFLTTASAAAFISAMPLSLSGCGSVNKNTLAGLAQTLGNAIANLATILGKTDIAAQVTQYTTQLVTDIKNWTPGSTTQDIILAIADLEDAINLIPVTPEIQGLIELALGTIQGILAFFPSAVAAVQARTKAPTVHLAKVPKDSKTFSTAWNAQVPSTMAGALIP